MSANVTKSMKIRLVFVVCGFLILFLFWVIGNLAYRSIVTGDELKAKASAQQLSDITIPANRGKIYDSSMTILAQSATVWNVQLSPLEILEHFKAAAAADQKNSKDGTYKTAEQRTEKMVFDLAELLSLDPEDIRGHLENTKSQYEIIAKKIEKPLADQLTALKAEKGYVGIYLEEDTKRYYPYNSLASSVIGFTNSSNQGAYGLEAKYNSILSGTDGRKVSAKDAWGEALSTTYEQVYAAKEGSSIVTTIDVVIQQYIESALDAAVTQYAPEQGAAIIVMDVNTGAIKGMVSYPNYNLNAPYTVNDSFLKA